MCLHVLAIVVYAVPSCLYAYLFAACLEGMCLLLSHMFVLRSLYGYLKRIVLVRDPHPIPLSLPAHSFPPAPPSADGRPLDH
jgi:hypothetical protein